MKTSKYFKDEMKVVKCGCGLPMRQKDWAAHWVGCRCGSSVPVTTDDVKALEDYETMVRARNEEHQKWLNESGPSKSRLCINSIGALGVEKIPENT